MELLKQVRELRKQREEGARGILKKKKISSLIFEWNKGENFDGTKTLNLTVFFFFLNILARLFTDVCEQHFTFHVFH